MKVDIEKDDLYPIMGETYVSKDFASIKLDKKHLINLDINTEDDLFKLLSLRHQLTQSIWLYGGYLEQRSLYSSTLFSHDNPDHVRDIHLGIDVWGPVNSPIYAPLSGTIHSFGYNGHHLDYGYTLVLKHEYQGISFHTLYGHLGSTYCASWKVGARINSGDLIADIGPRKENGGWIPHLHLQVIFDLEGKKGDYPGVCSQLALSHFAVNCPDPKFLIKKAP